MCGSKPGQGRGRGAAANASTKLKVNIRSRSKKATLALKTFAGETIIIKNCVVLAWSFCVVSFSILGVGGIYADI